MVQHTRFGFTYKYPWAHVTRAVWTKYPNEQNDFVVDVETLDQRYDEQKNTVHTTRLFKCQNQASKIFRALLQNEYVYFREESTIDLDERKFVMVTHNDSYNHMVNIEETATYFVHPNNEDWTRFTHEGTINCSRWGAVGEQFEKFSSHLYKQGAIKTHIEMHRKLDKTVAEGSPKQMPGGVSTLTYKHFMKIPFLEAYEAQIESENQSQLQLQQTSHQISRGMTSTAS